MTHHAGRPEVSENPFGTFRLECSRLLKAAIRGAEKIVPTFVLAKLVGEEIEIKLALPSKLEFGDLTTNVCFELARLTGRKPQELASELASAINELASREGTLLDRVEAVGGYLNFWARLADFSKLAIESAISLDRRYGCLRADEPKKIVVEHTSANPIHPMHVGHGRNSVLGDSLARLLRSRGHQVTTRFYVNDAGRQVAILAYGYDKLGRPEPTGKPDHFFGLVYAMTNCALEIRKLKAELEKAVKEGREEDARRVRAKLDEWAFSAFELKEKAPELFEKLYSAVESDEDPEASISEIMRAYEVREEWAVQLVRSICTKCLEGFKETLSKLGIEFDHWDWESDLLWSGKVSEVLARLEESGFVEVRGGALELDADSVAERFGLKEELGLSSTFKVPPLTLTRSDGTTLYVARDIAYTLEKFEGSNADEVINVIGADQKLAQMHIKIALHAMGEHERARRLVHFSYSLVRIPGTRMSSRRGRFITLDGLMEEAVARAYEEIPKHSPDLPEAERAKVAEAVGIGALKFALLAQDPDKEVVFTWDRVLNFEANSAPYVQYTHARACSILRKAGREPEQPDYGLLKHPLERELVLAVARFPEVVANAADSLRPDTVANFAVYLSDKFNSFYASLPVLRAEPKGLSDARLALVKAVRIVLRNALDLLGIEALERM